MHYKFNLVKSSPSSAVTTISWKRAGSTSTMSDSVGSVGTAGMYLVVRGDGRAGNGTVGA
jgi:hypothetical protein